MNPLRLNTIELPSGLDAKAPPATATTDAGTGFGQTLQNAIGQVEAMQNEADGEATKLAGGAGNLHETMLALEKADVAMRLALKVKNKIVDAYNEVMRMSV
jgi:flagellar hook-basal body complex protein FliE